MNISAKEMLFWVKAGAFAGGIAYFCFHYSFFSGLSASDIRSGAGIVAQLSGTMLGFVLAALAILMTVTDTTLMRNMHRTGHLLVLLSRMLACLVAFGFATLGGAVIIFVPSPAILHVYILIGFGLFAIALLADVCRKLWMVLKNLHPNP